MKQTDPQFKLRLPEDLKERIEAAAIENHRSMNAEVVARLQASFDTATPRRVAADKVAGPIGQDVPIDDLIDKFVEGLLARAAWTPEQIARFEATRNARVHGINPRKATK